MKKIKKFFSSIGNFLAKHKSSISLFTITLIVTLLTNVITSLCGASDLTKTVISASTGIMTLMGINSIEELIYMRLGDNKRPAVLGIIIGVLATLI